MRVFVKITHSPEERKNHFWSNSPGEYHASVLLTTDRGKEGFGQEYNNCPIKAETQAYKKALKSLAYKVDANPDIIKNYTT